MKRSNGWIITDIPRLPFFLNIWFHEPHAPIAAPNEIVSTYGELNNKAAIYSGTIDNTDRAIQRVVNKLDAMGIREDTLIIYASDNGSYLEDRTGNLGKERFKLGRGYSGAWNILLAKGDSKKPNPEGTCRDGGHLSNNMWVIEPRDAKGSSD